MATITTLADVAPAADVGDTLATALAEAISTPVILSGGVSCAEDVRRIRARAGSGIAGIIIGRALYDGAIIPQEALA
jgi:phosphoribosylformimino-5-aminoimidazole carboxamide ribotide isomerase